MIRIVGSIVRWILIIPLLVITAVWVILGVSTLTKSTTSSHGFAFYLFTFISITIYQLFCVYTVGRMTSIRICNNEYLKRLRNWGLVGTCISFLPLLFLFFPAIVDYIAGTTNTYSPFGGRENIVFAIIGIVVILPIGFLAGWGIAKLFIRCPKAP